MLIRLYADSRSRHKGHSCRGRRCNTDIGRISLEPNNFLLEQAPCKNSTIIKVEATATSLRQGLNGRSCVFGYYGVLVCSASLELLTSRLKETNQAIRREPRDFLSPAHPCFHVFRLKLLSSPSPSPTRTHPQTDIR